jgi:hypothetical protein
MRADLSVTGFAAEGPQGLRPPAGRRVLEAGREVRPQVPEQLGSEQRPRVRGGAEEGGPERGRRWRALLRPGRQRKGQPRGHQKVADKEIIQSYGAMTYDGIKTYIYAGLKKDSPEVKSAMDWVRKNYSVDMHPGFVYEEIKAQPHARIY